MTTDPAQPLWTPTEEQVAAAQVTAFINHVNAVLGLSLSRYGDLYKWSVEDPEAFWSVLWDWAGVIAETRGDQVLVDGDKMPGARFFPDARLNFAENLLRRRDDGLALAFWSEDKVKRRLSHATVYDQASRVSQALRALGVKPGDRVAGLLPNMPESVIAMLGATAVGATWASASPDFGVQGVLDRFRQIEPTVLIVSDGYFYNGKTIRLADKVKAVLPELPSVTTVVVVPLIGDLGAFDGVATTYDDFIGPQPGGDIAFEQLPFDHPLYIMFSSGTTGVPKCIVHRAGGVLLQHLKEHRLHCDVRRDDRVFYFTTLGWMMWNWMVSGLAAGAALLLYDGSPFAPDANILFDFADAEGMTFFGTSAKYIDALHKGGARPRETHSLATVRTMASTGSPLVPESFDYVYSDIKPDIHLASISGGTDLVSCFALGNPVAPVYRGELQTRGLGLAVDVFDDDGKPIRGEKGELVCTKPFPPMPLGFWGDSDGSRYHAAYFGRFPNIWCHGDFVELTERDGLIIYGRSDATLNPGGVRIGTAEIYRQVEQLDEVVESIVCGQSWDNDTRVVLFVRLRDGASLDDDLTARIKKRVREGASPRHVPAKIVQVTDIPRTKSGKIVELAVRNVIHGDPVKNVEALANPEALDQFKERPELNT